MIIGFFEPFDDALPCVQVPMHSLLGITSQSSRVAKAAQRKAKATGTSFVEALSRICSGSRTGLSSLPFIRMTHKLLPPERGTSSGASYTRKRQNVQIAVTYRLEVRRKSHCE